MTTSTNFTDSSLSPHTFTAYGNAVVTDSIYKFGNASGYFDGTNSYILTPDSPDWDLGTGNWTIDFWINTTQNPNTGPNNDVALITRSNAGVTFQLGVYLKNGGKFNAFLYDGTRICGITSSGSINDGNWHHCAVVVNSGNCYLYIDGTNDGSNATNVILNTNLPIYIGAEYNDNNKKFNGKLDELRFSAGIARWTTNFTPSTSEYAPDSYDKLLLHMNLTTTPTTFIPRIIWFN